MVLEEHKNVLAKARDGDLISWNEFYCAYQPLILSLGLAFGLMPAENEKLIQSVMSDFFQNNSKVTYDRNNGTFRDYLKKIIENQISIILCKRNNNDAFCHDNSSVANLLEKAWANNWRENLLKMALKELKNYVEPVTFQAFILFGVHRKKSLETANFLDISGSDVYIAKNHCLELFKKIISDMENEL